MFLLLYCYVTFGVSYQNLWGEEDIERDRCLKIRNHQVEKRDVPILVGTGSSSTSDDDSEFEPKMVLYYNFENQKSFLQISVQDTSPFENNGRFNPGGLVLQVSKSCHSEIPGSSCNYAAYLACSDIVLNGDTFQGKPTYGITVAAFIMLLDVKGRHNIFETYGYSKPRGQFHFEVDYGIVRWFHGNAEKNVVFEVAAAVVPQKTWTHVVGTFNSTTGIAQIFIDGKPANRTVGLGKMSKDWSCLARIGGACRSKALMGMIDEIRLYNYALSLKEVQNVFSQCTFTGSLAPTPSADTPDEPSNYAEGYFSKKNLIPIIESKESDKSSIQPLHPRTKDRLAE